MPDQHDDGKPSRPLPDNITIWEVAEQAGVKEIIVEALMVGLEVETSDWQDFDALTFGMLTEEEVEEVLANLEINGKTANAIHKASARKLFWKVKQIASSFTGKMSGREDSDVRPSDGTVTPVATKNPVEGKPELP